MGLLIHVYRDDKLGDCTGGGISSQHRSFVLVNADGPFEPKEDSPAVFLQHHVKGCLRVVPAMEDHGGGWTPAPGHHMFGGNYAATSDSRFSRLCEELLGHRFYGAVAIHDRQE